MTPKTFSAPLRAKPFSATRTLMRAWPQQFFTARSAMLCLTATLTCTQAQAAPGDIDPAWASQGVVRFSPGAAAAATALRFDSSGRLLAAGGTRMTRLLASGQPDTAFGNQGVITLELPATVTDTGVLAVWPRDAGRSAALLTGPVFCASPGLCSINGLFDADYMVARRLAANGAPETRPDDEVPGYSAILSARRDARQLIWTGTGELIVLAPRVDVLFGNTIRILRYSTEGVMSDLVNAGELAAPARQCLRYEFGSPTPLHAVGALDAAQRLVVAVRRIQDGTRHSLCLMRFLADGKLDTSYGTAGVAQVEDAPALQLGTRMPYRLFIRPDQSPRILLVEGSLVDARNPAWLSLRAEGGVDAARGNAGIEIMVPTSLTSIRDALQLPGGRVILAGLRTDAAGTALADAPLVASYGVDGVQPDFFGATSGVTSRPLITTSGRLQPHALTSAADGTIYVAGSWVANAANGTPGSAANGEFGVVRLEGVPAPSNPAPENGGGGGGGGCGSLDASVPQGPPDPSLPLLALMALLTLGWRTRQRR